MLTVPASPLETLALQQLLARIEDPDVVEEGMRPLHPEEVAPLWRAFSREGWCHFRAVTDESVQRFAGWLVRQLAATTAEEL